MKKIWSIFTPPCPVCGKDEALPRFKKQGASGKEFHLVRCVSCGLEFIHPQPTTEELNECYQSDYFTKRTDRGYDNYFSPEIRSEIERVIALNLKGLSFETFEFSMPGKKRSLDIGCAAGYFVNYIASRGWDAQGIEVSKPCVSFARDKLGLNVIDADYLSTEYTEKFDLITLWATIEHLPDPVSVLKKIFSNLRENGMLYISTCRTGGFFQKKAADSWRYYNFPEHLYFFSLPNLKKILRENGFTIEKRFTYGSGYGKPKTLIRSIADFAARHFGMGDMMVLAARKNRQKGRSLK
jgi:2-polyprenyl-3-methyl-5-hydroxy-6-metoxy-1,4-benzoquinol methylase